MSIRELILKRMDEIFKYYPRNSMRFNNLFYTIKGKHLNSKRNLNAKNNGLYPIDIDFNSLDDIELVYIFEMIINRFYRMM